MQKCELNLRLEKRETERTKIAFIATLCMIITEMNIGMNATCDCLHGYKLLSHCLTLFLPF